jgi:hypothetical protein
MTLRLDEAAGAFHLSLPYGVALTEGLDFAARRRRWILAQLAALPPRVAFAAGAEIPLFGVPHVIRHDPGARRGAWREAGTIWVSGFAEHLPRRVTDFLKAEARRELTARAHRLFLAPHPGAGSGARLRGGARGGAPGPHEPRAALLAAGRQADPGSRRAAPLAQGQRLPPAPLRLKTL